MIQNPSPASIGRPPAPTALAHANLITADAPRGEVVELCTTVALDRSPETVRTARLFATAHGVYEARVNDQDVADWVLSPGWTAYQWRLNYQEYDVTNVVRGGPTDITVSARVGNGWYRGDFGPWLTHNYGDDIGFIGALEIEYDDGHRQIVATSAAWNGHSTDVTQNSLYDGQRIDARLRGLSRPLPVRVVEFDPDTLYPQVSPPIRRQETLRPVRNWVSPSGANLIDFGQNLVGWLRFTVTGPAGTEITIRHAEALEDGELAMAPLRKAKVTDTFVLSGGEDFFEPTFTFHGSRYVEVSGWPGELSEANLEAVVVGSDIRRTGWFKCSDPRVNQLVQNSVWGQKGNFLSIPTDCPQRDERLGWTGDIAVYSPTAAYQFDVADFLHDWLLNLAVEQSHHSGIVPWVVPRVLNVPDGQWDVPAAIWGDAAAWVPEALWNFYGDESRLAAHYPAMAAHLRCVEGLISPTGLWDTGFQFGDWLDPDSPPQDAQAAKADPGVVATACLYRSARFAARAATVLGCAEADHWAGLAARTKEGFNEHYVHDGIVRSDCATVYALALHFGLLGEEDRASAAARLAELVRAADYKATTGFAGTPYVTWALSENGYVTDAYRLLLQNECPSWLYQVAMGATTMWERWDSVLPDGRLNDPIMTSLNHYAFGSVCDWLYQGVAGIRPAEPGFRRIQIKPTPGEGIDWVDACFDSPVGQIRVKWLHINGQFKLRVALPQETPAEVVMPDGSRFEVRGGNHEWSVPLG
ncbi:MAG: glycoside hydrolase family 78 protein [Propionibacteriaceae bacterium]|jgi:alpha-L-rhamnosidase|nr:glycoside hydrolase family 78 protein [Propionibacteriaceae bacterium]